ncbi:MAG: hypothetical protein HKN47_15750, partial [Pirellulaceae bacterium]|nr:hypothetical protein [Pirellulaceae bacterium]
MNKRRLRRSRTQRQTNPRGQRRRIFLEQLEQRRLLATVNVTTTMDVDDGDVSSLAALNTTPGADGLISLREAVRAANNTSGDDEIVLAAGVYSLTVAGDNEDAAATGDLDITDGLTIRGVSAGATTIDASGLDVDGTGFGYGDRVFDAFGVSLNLQDVTIRNGNVRGDGGGLRNDGGAVTLNNVVMNDNFAEGNIPGGGGAIYHTGGSTLNIDNSQFFHNCTVIIGSGGALFNDNSEVTISDSVFDGNATAEHGGAIYTRGVTGTNATLTIFDSTIINNGPVGPLQTKFGTTDGGGIYNDNDTVMIHGSTISNNEAIRDGGGIFTKSSSLSSATLELFQTTLAGNTAGGEGGGISNQGDAVRLENVTISGNSAGEYGGGIYQGVDTGPPGSIRSLNVTINANTAPLGSNLFNDRSGSTIELQNTIVAAGVGSGNCDGPITSLGNNLEDADTCGFLQGDFPNTDPLLDPLANNGGTALTHALAFDSPAIDAANTAAAPLEDQRRVSRPVGANADIGAVEFVAEISGVKYEDVNGNGIVDQADVPLPGWTIFLDGFGQSTPNGVLDAGEPVAITDDAGEFVFSVPFPGDFFVTEQLQSEWVGIGGAQRVTLAEGQTVEIDFLNFVPGSIHGFKFEDVDQSGTYDPQVDRPLPGVTFTLTGTDGLGNPVPALLSTATTDANGEFAFVGLNPTGASSPSGLLFGPSAQNEFDVFVQRDGDTFVDLATADLNQTTGVTFRSTFANFPAPGQAIDGPVVNFATPPGIIGTRAGGAADGQSRYEIVFDTPQSRAAVLRPWSTFSLTRFYAGDTLLAEHQNSTGTEFVGFISDSADSADWITRIELDGLPEDVGGRDVYQVGVTDDLYFGTATSGYTVTETVPAGSTATTPTSFTTDLLSRQELVAMAGQAMLHPIERLSEDSAGIGGNDQSQSLSISADGRFVAFASEASNLVPGDTNGTRDIFVFDRQTGAMELVSVDNEGNQAEQASFEPSISADGRFVAFFSLSDGLVPDDTNGQYDVFVYDRQTDEVERVSLDNAGIEGNGSSSTPSISADGRFVGFSSLATNLVPGDTNDQNDVFVFDRQTGVIERVNVSDAALEADDWSGNPSISADGRFVAFESHGTNLVPGDTNAVIDIFVYDRQSDTIESVTQGDTNSFNPSISADGHFVAFESFASNLVPGDTNNRGDVFVFDRQIGTTKLVSMDDNGVQGNNESFRPSINGDGRFVAFQSFATNLVPGDTNDAIDVFVYDRQTDAVKRVSVDKAGNEGNSNSSMPSISADGGLVAFLSRASNLVTGDANNTDDVFVKTISSVRTEVVIGAPLMFGNVAPTEVMISGTKYEDVNGNAIVDQFDVPLPGWTIFLDGFDGSTPNGIPDAGEPTAITDASGGYSFSVPTDGTYFVTEVVQPDWVASGDVQQAVDLGSGSVSAIDFLNFVPGSIHGFKFEDVDQSGTYDPQVDRPLSGVTFTLTGTDGLGNPVPTHLSTATTDDNGEFAFVGLNPTGTNSYTVTETVPAGSTATTPTSFTTELMSRQELVAMAGQAMLGIQRVAISNSGMESDDSSFNSAISADGRYVAFASGASNLVPGDTNDRDDIFFLDRQTGVLERISVANDGTEGNSSSDETSISADGRFISFVSDASNLVPGDTNDDTDVFVFDRQTRTVQRVSVNDSGVEADNDSDESIMSADGRFVAFHSSATNLVPGDTNGTDDVFVFDRQTNTIERVSVASDGTQANDFSGEPAISADGRFVAFESQATNLVPGDTDSFDDVFVFDRQTDTIRRISENAAGTVGNQNSFEPSISADGRFVTFSAFASNLVPGDTNGQTDVFVFDMQTGLLDLVSVDDAGVQGNASSSSDDAAISADGRYVAFASSATNLVPGDTNDALDVFVFDLQTRLIKRISVDATGAQGDGTSGNPKISDDGRFVSFGSRATNLVPGDTNDSYEIFVTAVNQLQSEVVLGAPLMFGNAVAEVPTAPGFDKVFAPNPIVVGGTSTLTFTIDNSANSVAASGLAFTDTLPVGVGDIGGGVFVPVLEIEIASPSNAATTCGGTVTAVEGSSDITFSGGTVAAASTCRVTVDVTSNVVGNGSHVNTSGDLTSSLGNSGNASDTLFVNQVTGAAPNISAPVALSTNEDTTLSLAGIAVDDPDSTSLTIDLAVNDGRLDLTSSSGLTAISQISEGNLTFTGPLSDVNAALNSVTYTPRLDFNDGDQLLIRASDGVETDDHTIDITINPINDGPINTVPGPQSVFNTDTLSFAPGFFSASDVDASTLEVSLSVTQGIVSLGSTSGLQITGNNSTSLTATGSITNLNTALGDLIYDPIDTFIGTDTLTMTTSDLGQTGAGGPMSDTDTVSITVTPPQVPLVVDDSYQADEGTGSFTLTPDPRDNDLRDSGATLNVTGVSPLSTQGGSLNFSSDTFTYTPPTDSDFFGTETFTYTIQQDPAPSTTGDSTDSGTITIEIQPINDGPINSIPGSVFVDEDNDLSFSGLNLISVQDIDAGTGDVTVTLTVNSGMLNVTNTGGVQGNGNNQLTINGTVSQVNNTLGGLTYTPQDNFFGSDALVVNTNDNGNTGATALSDNDTVNITINPINDAPTLVVPGQQSFFTDFDNRFSQADNNAFQVDDVDAGANDVRLDLTIPDGELTLDNTAGLIVSMNPGDNNGIRLVGSIDDINRSLADGLTYRVGTTGDRTLNALVNDLGNTGDPPPGAGNQLTASSSVLVGVADEDDSCLTGGPLQVGQNRLTYSCATPGGFTAFVVGTELGSHFFDKYRVTVDIADPSVLAIGLG